MCGKYRGEKHWLIIFNCGMCGKYRGEKHWLILCNCGLAMTKGVDKPVLFIFNNMNSTIEAILHNTRRP